MYLIYLSVSITYSEWLNQKGDENRLLFCILDNCGLLPADLIHVLDGPLAGWFEVGGYAFKCKRSIFI